MVGSEDFGKIYHLCPAKWVERKGQKMDRPNTDRRFVRESHWVTREIASETIVVPIRSHAGEVDAIYTLNELGTMIWQLIDGETSVRQIADEICTAYNVAPERATADIVDFLQSLRAAGIIKEKN